MLKKNKAGIDKRFAKTKDYKKTLEKIIKTDKCPFCPDNFKYHEQAQPSNSHSHFLILNSF